MTIFGLLSKDYDLPLFFKLNADLRSYIQYMHTDVHTHVIMKYVWTPTSPVNPHDLLGGIVIMMVLCGMQNTACDEFCANCAH